MPPAAGGTSPTPTIASDPGSSNAPTLSSAAPSIGNGTASSVPTVANETSTLVPTVPSGTASPVAPGEGPTGSLYFEGFENGQFPIAPWFTEGDAPWEIDTERVRTGTYSIRSGALDLTDLATEYSNLTFITNSDWPDGSLIVSALVGTELPIDELSYFVNGESRGKLTQNSEWQQLRIPLPPGANTILFSYISNPFGLQELPPASSTHLEAVYFDNVYFIPFGVTAAPTVVSVNFCIAVFF